MSAADNVQNFKSHARYVPGFHFVTGGLTIVILGWMLYRLFTLRTSADVLGVLIAIVLLMQFIYLRGFPLAVQDRVIRLEERLRMAQVLPADLRSRCDEFTPAQLIALRFASDAELPALARKVLAEKITDRSAIKALIVNWRPDHMRA
jgi:hypothetical protein